MIDIIKNYASNRLELLKLEATEKSSLGVSATVYGILVLVTLVFFITLLNIGLGLWMGSMLGNYGYGMLIVSGFYLLLFIVLLLARKSITTKISDKIVKSILS